MLKKARELLKGRRRSANERFEKFRHEHSLVFAAFVLGIAALVVINTLFMIRLLSENREGTIVVYPSWTTSLQLAYNGAIQAQVRNVATKETDTVFPIDSTQVILVMEITVKNTTRKAQQFIPVNHLYIRGEEGSYAALHMSSHAARPIPATDLVPGGSVSGQISFVIPKTVSTPRLYVDTGWDRSIPLVIDVMH